MKSSPEKKSVMLDIGTGTVTAVGSNQDGSARLVNPNNNNSCSKNGWPPAGTIWPINGLPEGTKVGQSVEMTCDCSIQTFIFINSDITV